MPVGLEDLEISLGVKTKEEMRCKHWKTLASSTSTPRHVLSDQHARIGLALQVNIPCMAGVVGCALSAFVSAAASNWYDASSSSTYPTVFTTP